jgi:hypothetical protein
MNRIGIKGFLIIILVCLSALLSSQAGVSHASSAYLYTNQELDNLLAPIALYPDPLLAQMLPASTYPAEMADAEAWINSGGTISSIDGQNWDESVKAIAHYPDIVKMMAGNMDWTASVGDAFLNQPEAVASSIQRLRRQAREAGNLESTPQQEIVIESGNIEIIPAQPAYIYVPQYDPSVIYIQRWTPDSLPFITFGLGLVIGGWMTLDFDWGFSHIIYHGWNRPGWVNHARPHVRIKNVYVHRSRPDMRPKWKHDASRSGPERYRASHPGGNTRIGRNTGINEIRGNTKTPPKLLPQIFGPAGDTKSFSNRGKESRRIVLTPSTKPPQDLGKGPIKPAKDIRKQPSSQGLGFGKQPLLPPQGLGKQPSPPIQGVGKQPLAPVQGMGKAFSPPRSAPDRLQPARTPSVTFGGYREDKEAKSQSLRGQTSRQSSERTGPSIPAGKGREPSGRGDLRGSAPTGKGDVRGSVPAGKDSNRGRKR